MTVNLRGGREAARRGSRGEKSSPRRSGVRAALVALLVVAGPTLPSRASEALPALGASIVATSVSGLSSGAYMAGQIQLAHAKDIVGAGLVAGGPFACAESTAGSALGTSEGTAGDEPGADDVLAVRELDLPRQVGAGGQAGDGGRRDRRAERGQRLARSRRKRRSRDDEQRHQRRSHARATRRAFLATQGAFRCLAFPSQIHRHTVNSSLLVKNFLHR